MVVSFKEKAQWNLIKQADIEVVADSKNQGCGVVADAITVWSNAPKFILRGCVSLFKIHL